MDGDAQAQCMWFTAAELVGLGGLPTTERRVRARAEREGWISRPRQARGGGLEYSRNSLPLVTQANIAVRFNITAAQASITPPPRTPPVANSIEAARERYTLASVALRAIADKRAGALDTVQHLVANGASLMAAREIVAEQMIEAGESVSVPTLCRWRREVGEAPRDLWPALLLPRYAGRTATAACAEQCWDWFKGHYLTRRQPSLNDSYRRLEEMAKTQGWTIPSCKTLTRRMEAEVSRYVQTLLREGPEAAARLIPTQQRDESVFSAGQAVNGDGLKFDTLWVRFEDGEIINTATAWFWQCIATRRLLAWRLAKTENTDVFRLATYDLTGICAPSEAWMDNTRVAANKVMTAGANFRHRFNKTPEDGVGLLQLIGIEPHFTNPDKEQGNPGAKPIERAFGIGGIHEMVSTNPRLIGRGYNKATAIDVAELREVIAAEVKRFNAREGRRTRACGGVLSFDQAWADGLAKRPPRVLADCQRQLLLMSREIVTADRKSGLITLAAGRGPHGANRYWCERMMRLAGTKVAVHFDPENLSADVHVYGLDGRYITSAQHLAATAFNDTNAGREYGKFKARAIKAGKKQAAAEVRMDDLARATLYAASTGQALPTKPERRKRDSKVVEGHFKHVANPARDAAAAARGATGTDDHTVSDRFFTEMAKRLKDKAI